MKKQFLTLSMIAALSACGSDDANNTEATPADISGDFSGTATKAENPTGRLLVTDVNENEALIYPASITGQFGTFSINAAGNWEYTLDQSNEQIEALVSSDMPSLEEDTFTVKTVDGTTADVAITIDGIDVPAIISGALNFTVFYDDGSASEEVRLSDANPAEAFFAEDQNPTATYGSATFEAGTETKVTIDPETEEEIETVIGIGTWTYDLDESHPDVKALNYAEETDTPPTLDDTFTIRSLDGTEGTVTITITGSQLIPAVIEGDLTADLSPDLGLFTTGTLTIADPNFGQEVFEEMTDFQTTYGHFSINDAGEWRYDIDENNADIQALNKDSVALSETITVTAVDKTTADIVINIAPPLESLKVAKITHVDGSGRIRLDFSDKLKAGKAVFRTKFTDLVQAAEYTLITTKPWDTGYGIIGIFFNPDGSIALQSTPTRTASTSGGSTKQQLLLKNTFTQGEWIDVEMTWDATNAVADSADDNLDGTPAQITLKINGEAVRSADDSTITTDVFDSLARNIQSVLGGVDKFQLRCGTGAADPAGSCYVDDIRVFSAEGELKIYENFEEGSVLESGKNVKQGAKYGSGAVEHSVIVDDQ